MNYIEREDFNYWIKKKNIIEKKIIEKENKITLDYDSLFYRVLEYYKTKVSNRVMITKYDEDTLKNICKNFDEKTITFAIDQCYIKTRKNRRELRFGYIETYLTTQSTKEKEKLKKWLEKYEKDRVGLLKIKNEILDSYKNDKNYDKVSKILENKSSKEILNLIKSKILKSKF